MNKNAILALLIFLAACASGTWSLTAKTGGANETAIWEVNATASGTYDEATDTVTITHKEKVTIKNNPKGIPQDPGGEFTLEHSGTF
jgi:hypothetical protein